MNEPLGNACGLWCEIQESIETLITLKGNPGDSQVLIILKQIK